MWFAVGWLLTVTPLTFYVNFSTATPQARVQYDEARAHLLDEVQPAVAVPTGQPSALAAARIWQPASPIAAYLVTQARGQERYLKQHPVTAQWMSVLLAALAGVSVPFLLGLYEWARRCDAGAEGDIAGDDVLPDPSSR
jgi:hypothetical protein